MNFPPQHGSGKVLTLWYSTLVTGGYIAGRPKRKYKRELQIIEFILEIGEDYIQWWKLCRWELLEHNGKLVEDMETDNAFEIAMNTWARWIDQNIDTTKTLVFFRSISPEHKGQQWCYNKTEPIMDESYIATFPKPIIEIVERTTGGMKTPVKYLNITKLAQYRIDAHPTIYVNKPEILRAKQQSKPESYADCSHWWLPGLPDTWNTLLYASLVLSN